MSRRHSTLCMKRHLPATNEEDVCRSVPARRRLTNFAPRLSCELCSVALTASLLDATPCIAHVTDVKWDGWRIQGISGPGQQTVLRTEHKCVELMLTGGPYQSSRLQRTRNHVHIGRSCAQSCSVTLPAWRTARRKLSGATRSISACQAAGVAEAEKVEESEVFRTNDGVIEPVDDDEAEVRDTHAAHQDSHSLLQGASCLYRLTFWEKAQVGTCDLYKE